MRTPGLPSRGHHAPITLKEQQSHGHIGPFLSDSLSLIILSIVFPPKVLLPTEMLTLAGMLHGQLLGRAATLIYLLPQSLNHIRIFMLIEVFKDHA